MLVEKDEADAYLFITQMTQSLLLWGLVGLGVAVAGAILLAVRISRPILEIARVTVEVAKGNFQARVGRGAELKDENGDLARCVNDMTTGLNERVHLQKFVSGGTIGAIRLAKGVGISLGGVRVTTLFCGIRGYTAFAECYPPDVVVQVLNYFSSTSPRSSPRTKAIDQFVGDQIFAVFQGGGMERNAVRCAIDMQRKMGELSRERREWDLTIGIGVNTAEVVMGAMGSRQRMDYTVLPVSSSRASPCARHVPTAMSSWPPSIKPFTMSKDNPTVQPRLGAGHPQHPPGEVGVARSLIAHKWPL
ncbi:MAG: adenylate/guanylate cyclase domain-containing protein [Rhodoplanes sp.]